MEIMDIWISYIRTAGRRLIHAEKTITVKYTIMQLRNIELLVFIGTIAINTSFVSIPCYNGTCGWVNLLQVKCKPNFISILLIGQFQNWLIATFKTIIQYLRLRSGRCLKWYQCSHFTAVSHASYIVGSQTLFLASGLSSFQQICVNCLCFLVKESKSKLKLTSS